MHMTNSAVCPMCNMEEESLFHCFRDCQKAPTVWLQLLKPFDAKFFEETNWTVWLLKNLRNQSSRGSHPNWHLVFGSPLDQFWQARNELVFSQKSYSTQLLYWRIKDRVSNILQVKNRDHCLRPLHHSSIDDRNISWKAPSLGFHTLNCDGAVSGAGSMAGCDGLLRNENGDFIFDFLISWRIVQCWGLNFGLFFMV